MKQYFKEKLKQHQLNKLQIYYLLRIIHMKSICSTTIPFKMFTYIVYLKQQLKGNERKRNTTLEMRTLTIPQDRLHILNSFFADYTCMN